MYTQCPKCSTAFRVTAIVLKQAAGKVRCGGCGHAFNALEYLSESMPEQPAANDVEENLPELTPEPLQKDDGLPTSISAEQSAALLKTLDELAGSDIRIEDTGVEWRVLDEDELGDSPVDEVLEESPTPVDQFLTETPAQIDSPEIFHEEANAPAQTPVEELRFDDNTPLPDDFDFGIELPDESPPSEEPSVEEDVAVEEMAAAPQPDVELSEPDEWTDILDEFDDLGAAPALPLDEELAALDEELAVEAAEDPEPEAAAEEPEEPEDSEEPESVAEAADDELQLDEPEIGDEPTIANELDALEAEAEIEDENESEDSAGQDAEVDALLDMDTQFALQAEAMGIDLSGIHDTTDEEPAVEDDLSIDELLSTDDDEDREIDDLLDEDLVDEVNLEAQVREEDLIDDSEIEDSGESVPDDEAEQLDLIDEVVDEDDEPVEAIEEEDDVEPEEEQVEDAEEEPQDQAELQLEDEAEEEPVDDEPEVPPLSEEEQTINMQIDADLMAIAIEDEEGFASTIIIPDSKAEEAVLAEKADEDASEDTETVDEEAEKALKDTSAGFETIIMEGEEIHSGLERQSELEDEDKAAAAALVGAAAAEREAEQRAAAGGRRWIMIVGAVVLVLALALQAVHQQRDVLAKTPAFNNIAGPLYRAIGQPLAPEWDVRGWRFETTRHVVERDEEDGVETASENVLIYSRLGNSSDESLPYPIIVVALSDRFEEPVGSITLDPADYLPADMDPRELVGPGVTFEASVTVHSPPPEATGFRLRPCYRTIGGDLRCKDAAFK